MLLYHFSTLWFHHVTITDFTVMWQSESVVYHHTDVTTLPSAGRPSQREEEERRDAVYAPGHAQGTTVTLFLLTVLYMAIYQKLPSKDLS